MFVRRFTICLFIIALAFAAGCSNTSQDGDQSAGIPGVTETEITLGSSLPLTGHAAYLGTQTLLGAQAYLNSVNESGGVYGRTIRVIAKDDAYDPPRCLANTQKFLIDGNVFALFSYVGTPTTVTVLPLLEDAKIPLLGMFTGANALREPFNRYLINIRASYYQETKAAVRQLVQKLGMKRIAVFYQYDAYGFDGLVGTELALQSFGMEPVARGSYIRGTLKVEEALDKIMASRAEAVVMVGTYSACARFISEAGTKGYNPVFYNVSFVGAEELARRLKLQPEARVVMSQVVPPPDAKLVMDQQESPPGVVVEYLQAVQAFSPGEPPSFAGLEGYINARILVEGLQRAGPDLTCPSFIRALESIQDFPLGSGASITFGPNDHQGMDKVYFTRLLDGRFQPFDDWAELGPVR